MSSSITRRCISLHIAGDFAGLSFLLLAGSVSAAGAADQGPPAIANPTLLQPRPPAPRLQTLPGLWQHRLMRAESSRFTRR